MFRISIPRGVLWGLAGGVLFGAAIGLNGVNWNFAVAAETLPTLVGHLVSGAALGLAFGAMLDHKTTQPVRIRIDKRR